MQWSIGRKVKCSSSAAASVERSRARRLSEAGLDVVLLERGPWRDTVPTRSMGIEARAPLPQGRHLLTHGFRSVRMPFFRKKGLTINKRGYFEALFGNGMWLFCTSNVGGGSHAYAGLHDRPGKARFWDGHHPDLSHDDMDPYYDEIIAEFGSRPVTAEDKVPNHRALMGGNGRARPRGPARAVGRGAVARGARPPRAR